MHEPLVSHLLGSIRVDDVMHDLARVSAFDRYQASLGLAQAADVVAEAAVGAGLSDVDVRRYPADGAAQWWTFRAPVSWTPLRAAIRVLVGSSPRPLLEVDHAAQPFAVATYSAPTGPSGRTAPLVRATGTPLGREFSGAVAVVDRAAFTSGSLLADLLAAGALGLVTDAPWKGNADLPHPGRIELPADSALFAFSLTPPQFATVAAAAEHGAVADVVVEVDHTAMMPIVSGVLPGKDADEEVWLTAHLCHPRPGANDNASGVAAILGIARALAEMRARDAAAGTRRAIRFFWGPEFVGTAAILHRHAGGTLPTALVNLDMVGEDQVRCGSPFVVERAPETRPVLLTPLAEHVVAQVFAATAEHPGRWQPSPFLGFSDHSLYADPSIGRPAVQFCHPDDRFNHSAADSLDKVSEMEMLRSTAAGAVLAHLLADDGPDPCELRALVDRWCEGEAAAADRIARERGAWGRALRDHVLRANDDMRALAAGAEPVPARSARLPDDGPAVRARWDGPLNLRAMLAELPVPSRTVLTGLIAEDKQHLSVLFNLAIRADGRRSRRMAIAETSFALRRPLDDAVVNRLFDALVESGWVAESD